MVASRLSKIPSQRVGDFPDFKRFFPTRVQIIDLAMSTNCAIIPIGGGTSVSNALECPEYEKRAVISMDMALMDKIIWIDKENLTCRAQVCWDSCEENHLSLSLRLKRGIESVHEESQPELCYRK